MLYPFNASRSYPFLSDHSTLQSSCKIEEVNSRVRDIGEQTIMIEFLSRRRISCEKRDHLS